MQILIHDVCHVLISGHFSERVSEHGSVCQGHYSEIASDLWKKLPPRLFELFTFVFFELFTFVFFQGKPRNLNKKLPPKKLTMNLNCPEGHLIDAHNCTVKQRVHTGDKISFGKQVVGNSLPFLPKLSIWRADCHCPFRKNGWGVLRERAI